MSPEEIDLFLDPQHNPDDHRNALKAALCGGGAKHWNDWVAKWEERNVGVLLDFSGISFEDIKEELPQPHGQPILNFWGYRFPAVSFKEVVFPSLANFFNTNFSGEAEFSNANFSSDANFSNANLSRYTDFSNANFSRLVYFHQTKFSFLTYFTNANFSEHANFSNAKFSARVHFEEAEFFDTVDFRKC